MTPPITPLGSRYGIQGALGRSVKRGGFSPTDIAGLQLWLDFSDASTLFKDAGITPVSADGDAICQANDKSGNGYHARQTDSSCRPLYKTGVQNSKSVARFDGENDFFALSNISVASGSKSLFVVYSNNDSLSGSAEGSHYFLDSQTGRLIFAGHCHTGFYNKVGFFDGIYWHEIALAINGWQSLGFVLASGGNGTIYRNSGLLGAEGYTDKAIGGTSYISRAVTAPISYITGDVAEMILYDSALSDTDRGKVETYLNNKWAIY